MRTYLIAYGMLFLAVILVLPQGVVPGVAAWIARRRAARARTTSGGREQSVRGGVPGTAA